MKQAINFDEPIPEQVEQVARVLIDWMNDNKHILWSISQKNTIAVWHRFDNWPTFYAKQFVNSRNSIYIERLLREIISNRKPSRNNYPLERSLIFRPHTDFPSDILKRTKNATISIIDELTYGPSVSHKVLNMYDTLTPETKKAYIDVLHGL